MHPALEVVAIDDVRGRGVVTHEHIAAGTVVVISRSIISVDEATEDSVKGAFEKSWPYMDEKQRDLYNMLLKLPTNDILGAFQTNACKAIPDALCPEKVCLYPQVSLFNHSCMPNCVQTHFGCVSVVRAVESIHAEAELTVSYLYGANYFNLAGRYNYLQKFRFRCSCPLCEFQATTTFTTTQARIDDAIRQLRASFPAETVAKVFLDALDLAEPADFLPYDGVSEILLYCFKNRVNYSVADRLAALCERVWESIPLSTFPSFQETSKVLVALKKCPNSSLYALKVFVLDREQRKHGTLHHIERKFKRQLEYLQ